MGTLHRAVRSGNAEEVATLLAQGSDPNALSVHGFSPLMIAAQKGDLELVSLLLDAGADVGVRNPKNRNTALPYAVQHPVIIARLLDAGIVVDDCANPRQMTVLQWASMIGALPSVELLIARGASPHHQDKDGKTALGYARSGKATMQRMGERDLQAAEAAQSKADDQAAANAARLARYDVIIRILEQAAR